jgi:hypothetical protein
MIGSLIKSYLIVIKFNSFTTIETPTTNTDLDTIRALTNDSLNASPTLHPFSADRLNPIQSLFDIPEI